MFFFAWHATEIENKFSDRLLDKEEEEKNFLFFFSILSRCHLNDECRQLCQKKRTLLSTCHRKSRWPTDDDDRLTYWWHKTCIEIYLSVGSGHACMYDHRHYYHRRSVICHSLRRMMILIDRITYETSHHIDTNEPNSHHLSSIVFYMS